MKNFLFFLFSIITPVALAQISTDYAKLIDIPELTKHLEIVASDKMRGRETGDKGQKLAAKYLAKEFEKIGLTPCVDGSFFQEFTFGNQNKKTENVLGYLEGSDIKQELIVITAHYDHLGKRGKKIYNGADDDGSGVVTILELAQAFMQAKMEGNGPRRSILFMHVSGEEKGLLGSKYYTDNPVFPLENTVANLNIDMIGRIDEYHYNDSNYVYLIGSDRLSSQLHLISEKANEKYVNLNIDYTYNHPDDPNRFYYRSDHYNFAKNNIPVIFYFTGVHEDYHKPTDTIDKILFWKIERIAKLIFHTAWELTNREERITVDNLKDF